MQLGALPWQPSHFQRDSMTSVALQQPHKWNRTVKKKQEKGGAFQRLIQPAGLKKTSAIILSNHPPYHQYLVRFLLKSITCKKVQNSCIYEGQHTDFS